MVASGLLAPEQVDHVKARVAGMNTADLTRQINRLQLQLHLIELSQSKTEAMAATRHLDMAPLKPSIHRLQTTK